MVLFVLVFSTQEIMSIYNQCSFVLKLSVFLFFLVLQIVVISVWFYFKKKMSKYVLLWIKRYFNVIRYIYVLLTYLLTYLDSLQPKLQNDQKTQNCIILFLCFYRTLAHSRNFSIWVSISVFILEIFFSYIIFGISISFYFWF